MHQGFITSHQSFEIRDIHIVSETIVDLPLAPLVTGETIILKNIFFTPNKFDLLSQSYEELDKLVLLLKENPKLKIQVSGHTNKNKETEQFNIDLSTNRALAVKNYLIQKGIADGRVTYVGYGFSKPIYVGDSVEKEAVNRRVEVTVLSH